MRRDRPDAVRSSVEKVTMCSKVHALCWIPRPKNTGAARRRVGHNTPKSTATSIHKFVDTTLRCEIISRLLPRLLVYFTSPPLPALPFIPMYRGRPRKTVRTHIIVPVAHFHSRRSPPLTYPLPLAFRQPIVTRSLCSNTQAFVLECLTSCVSPGGTSGTFTPCSGSL